MQSLHSGMSHTALLSALDICRTNGKAVPPGLLDPEWLDPARCVCVRDGLIQPNPDPAEVRVAEFLHQKLAAEYHTGTQI